MRLATLALATLCLAGCATLPGVPGNSAGARGASDGKVPVCHRGKTIRVAPEAVAAHLRHGDHRGACRR